jgi:ribose 5-phosphate isomerase B
MLKQSLLQHATLSRGTAKRSTSVTDKQRVALGADHAGFELKKHVAKLLADRGYDVIDCGVNSNEPVDYPDIAASVSREVQSGAAWRGIVVCGSGAGACIAANKLNGIRAAVCHDTYTAHQAVEHDDVNVLCLGGRVIGIALADDILDSWLSAEFTGEDRHVRRVGKIAQLECDESSEAVRS